MGPPEAFPLAAAGSAAESAGRPRDRPQPPPRVLPVLYYGAAHLSLAVAFGAIAIDPRAVSGFFYHARILGIVHLVTLGWVTASILGSLYVVGPIALRAPTAARWIDYAAFALVAAGVVGMVAHFWLEEYGGMAWSAMTVAAGIMAAGASIVPAIWRASLPPAIKAHVALAFANILGAATLGILIGFDKVYHFLPGFVLAHVFAHAHLAAIGWGSMMVVGIGYRLLPMVLPSAMPAGPRLWMTAVLLETGACGLFVSLLQQRASTGVFAVVVAIGFAAFLWQVAWMFRHRRPKPPGLASPDPAVLHAAAAFGSLVITIALGLWLAFTGLTPAALRVATAYGVFGLVGFLAQIVVAMEVRLFPLFAWYGAYASSGFKTPPPSPHGMAWRTGQEIVFALWLVGVPALAAGLAFDVPRVVGAAGWTLLVATIVDSANAARILAQAFRRPAAAG